MTGERLDKLKLAPMVEAGNELREGAFTVSVDAGAGVTTGIRPMTGPKQSRAPPSQNQTDDLSKPGHVFPLRYKEGGSSMPGRPHGGRGGFGAPGDLAPRP